MVELIKEKLKTIIGLRGTLIVNHLLRRNFSPMSLNSKISPNESYSDFFFYSPLFYLNTYRAENTLALLLKKPINVRHQFVFYSKNGLEFKRIFFDSSDFIISFDFPVFKTLDKYLSFTHEIIPLKSEFKIRNFIGKNKLVSLQHRGYTIFKKQKNSVGSSVHGNFGVVCPSNLKKSGAKQSQIKFSYTPSYEFDDFENYDLLFNNPTNKVLKIEIKFKNRDLYFSDRNLSIKPMGTNHISLSKYKGQISIYSKLPICRPLIFKNPEIEAINFDVLHS